jgi:peroxiredoxin family protein
VDGIPAELSDKIAALVDARVDQILQGKLVELLTKQSRANDGAPSRTRRLAIVASKGSLDMAYPPLILASTAAAMGWEASIFFTFYGLDIITKKKLRKLKVAPVGNPAMPVPVPNIVGAIPGMTAMATNMMKSWFTRARIPTVEDLLDITRESGVELIACTTTMGVMGVKEEDIVEGATLAGAAAFLDYAAEATVSLFV